MIYPQAEHPPSDELTKAVETDIARVGTSDHADEKVRQQGTLVSTSEQDQPSLNIVSDNLIDIAVWATMALKRFKHDEPDPQALEALCKKIRSKAIKTRRMANKLSHPNKTA